MHSVQNPCWQEEQSAAKLASTQVLLVAQQYAQYTLSAQLARKSAAKLTSTQVRLVPSRVFSSSSVSSRLWSPDLEISAEGSAEQSIST